MQDRTYRAGQSIEDYCRACKADRTHTVIVVDATGRPIRVACGFCRSEHNYRGGPATSAVTSSVPAGSRPRARTTSAEPFPIVSDRERIASNMSTTTTTTADLEMLLRRIIREEAFLNATPPAEKW